MDISKRSTSAPGKGLRKRPLFPGAADDSVSDTAQVALATGFTPPNTSTDVDPRSKRVRLTNEDPEIASLGLPKDVSMHDRLSFADLPHEILQHIFTYVDPISLGGLICVGRLYHSLLDSACPLPQMPGSSRPRRLAVRSRDLIWAISRRTFLQGFPKPMDRMSELEMWRLIRGHSCQFCGRKATLREALSMSDPWNAGPGLDDARPIWPFRVRSCGRCLQPRLIKVSFSYGPGQEQCLISRRTRNCLSLPIQLSDLVCPSHF